jgi:hypothetical protein
MDIPSNEPEIQSLMLAGLDGDATAYKALLTRLSAHLRGCIRNPRAWMDRLKRGSGG